ncbi:uncharacterized protein METZ01_LOCUS441331 [marine metagenome]|uniref:Uncharacterized protein n=1 Tax=marine metagenome TaxID=408172 RepID=A0A382YYX3_9ZZZZ
MLAGAEIRSLVDGSQSPARYPLANLNIRSSYRFSHS